MTSSCSILTVIFNSETPKGSPYPVTSGAPHVLRISYKDHVTNEEVCAKIQPSVGPHEDLLTIAKRCKLLW